MCEFCENINPLKMVKNKFFHGLYPEKNEVGLVSYEEDGEKCFAIWSDGGGDPFCAGIDVDYINFCPICGMKLGD